MKRHGGINPEVAPQDLESPTGSKGPMISMAPPHIQPYQGYAGGQGEQKVHGRSRSFDSEGLKKVAAAAGGIWILGVLLGYDFLWPVYLLLDVLGSVLSIPPLSWIFSWIWTPVSWIFGWAYRGAPLVEQTGALQELRLPSDQVHVYLDQYVQQYGDAALIFATHDGYPQIVNGLLYNRDLGYADLLDATDENGNTALIYAASKGYRQCTAALLRSGVDPDIANQGAGGRTPLMEAAGSGHKDIVAALRLSNATIDAVDDYGNTALHYASYHGHLSTVHELLKGSPRKDIQNSYGHTAASYASSNKHKAIADLLNRGPSKREIALQAKKAHLEQEQSLEAGADVEDDDDLDVPEQPAKRTPKAKDKEPKDAQHVKGAAEDLHKRDEDFAPKVEREAGGLSSKERKALEDQVAKLRRQHEDAELKAQKRIIELLEKSSSHQQALDDADREVRAYKLNTTEMSLKVQELESKHHASELKASEEKDRAEKFDEEMRQAQLEVERHKARAEGAEKERDMHMDAAKRHEESLKSKHDEVNDHLQRLEKQQQDLSSLRGDLKKREEELQRHKEMASQLQRELELARGSHQATGAGATDGGDVQTGTTSPAPASLPAESAEDGPSDAMPSSAGDAG